MTDEANPARRSTDSVIGIVASGLKRLWDFIDARDIDKHAVSLAILWGTWKLTAWGMEFASLVFTTEKSGVEIAAVVAAVTAPYMALQAAAIHFYFRSRSR